jgi:hypothetical protein
MSSSALSIDSHFRWMLCYLATIDKIAELVTTSNDVPQFGKLPEFCAYTIRVGGHVRAHALAIREALPPRVLGTEAPWV